MNEESTRQNQESREHRYGHCGPWTDMHRKMWMYGPMMAAKFAGRSFRSGYGKSSRAERWLYENPTEDQIVAFLEEFQRDLEQQIEDVRTRIEEVKRRGER